MKKTLSVLKTPSVFKTLSVLALAALLSLTILSCADDSSDSNEDSVVTPGSQAENLSEYWYKNTSFYHIWVKSFANGSQTNSTSSPGTFKGIKANLDYIKDNLGCDGIWLSPVFDCSYKGSDQNFNMHGYDTTNYETVNDYFGTEQDLANLITACHEKDIKIIFDFVPNHTSINHNWFSLSKNKKTGTVKIYNDATNYTEKTVDFTDWYVWDSKGNSLNPLSQQGNNDSGGAWFYDNTRKEYYYAVFGKDMPDLNYENSDVKEYMLGIVKKWLDFGFDGLRIDACQYLQETSSQGTGTAETHAFFAKLRKLLDSYTASPKFMIGETWIEGDRNTLDSYFGTQTSPEFNMVFDFDAGRPLLSSVQKQTDKTDSTLRQNPSDFAGLGYGTFLCNHDVYEDRIGTEFNGDELGIKLSTTLSLMRPTVPFIYYGQEIGMSAPNGGFSKTNSSDMEMRYNFDWAEAKKQISDKTSTLSLNKALNTLRKSYPQTFSNGQITKLTTEEGTLAYTIKGSDANLLCVYNLTENAISSLTVSGNLNSNSTSYSTLIGDIEKTSTLTLTENTATVGGLAPYAYRVYLLGRDDVENLYDSEVYTTGDSHQIEYESKIAYDKMYLRGSMNSWGTSDSMKSDDGGYTWYITKNLAKGYYEFKFDASGAWTSGMEWGSIFENFPITINTVTYAVGGENICITIETAGNYTFTFYPTTKRVTVTDSSTTIEDAKDNTVYLRGTMTSWADYCGIPMPKTASNTYSLNFYVMNAGTQSFKISKEADNWDVNWGSTTSADQSVTFGVPMKTGSGGNLIANFSAEKNITITLNTSDNTITVIH